jgi:hypothetical protein
MGNCFCHNKYIINPKGAMHAIIEALYFTCTVTLSMITHHILCMKLLYYIHQFVKQIMAFINKVYVHLLLSVLAQKIHSQLARMFGRLQNWQLNSYYDERVVG